MKRISCAAAALAVVLGASFTAAAMPAPAPAPEGAQMNWPWDQPPSEFKEVERQGFHDGVQGAMKDYDHHRFPSVENRKEYRKPHVHPSLREDYRKGFRRGYDDAMKHLMQTHGQHS